MLRKKTKHCSIGDLEFDLCVNRSMVSKAFEQNQELWKVIFELKKLQGNSDNVNEEDYLTYFDTVERFEQSREDFVRYIFPIMLEEGKTPLYDNGSYEEMAKTYLDYAEDNECLYDEDGVIALLFNFAMSVFTIGEETENKKPKIRLNI